MECTVYGVISKPVVVLVGGWDPLIPDYHSLIKTANKYCASANYDLLLVMLDPLPSNFLFNRVSPIYDCVNIRIKLMQHICSGAVCKVTMNKTITDAGVQYFLPTLHKKFNIAELWLKARQTLGSGPENSIRDIQRLCQKLSIKFKTMPFDNLLYTKAETVVSHLRNGQIVQASTLVKRMPLWERNGNEQIAVGWQTGRYEYCAVNLSRECEVLFENKYGALDIFHNIHGHAVFKWPDNNIDLIAISETNTFTK